MRNQKRFEWNGRIYLTVKEYCKALGVSRETAYYRAKNGIVCEDQIAHSSRIYSAPYEWNGVIYPSRKAMAKALFISEETVKQRRRAGYKKDSDMKYQGGISYKPIEGGNNE